MAVPIRLHQYSYQDYLAIEQISTVKHEYLDGEIYAMGGGSVLHAALSAAMLASLHSQLVGRCRVYSSDLRIRVPATGLVSYADVAVVCGPVETDAENRETITNPTVLVEVLSSSTIDYDLGEKLDHYKQVPSLRAVVYVWQDRRQVQIHERLRDGRWESQTAGAGQAAAIESMQWTIDADTLYAEADGP